MQIIKLTKTKKKAKVLTVYFDASELPSILKGLRLSYYHINY